MKLLAIVTASALALAACEQAVTVSNGGSDGYNRVVDIVNETGVTMMRFYASNAGRSTWGPDQLGTTVLLSGRYITLNFDDGTSACVYDFKAEFANGTVARRDNINVCVESSWTVY